MAHECYLFSNPKSSLSFSKELIEEYEGSREIILFLDNTGYHPVSLQEITAPDIANEVDVLQAIRWIKQAWDEVPEEIVQKCFDKRGFSNEVQNNERSEEEEDQEFAELVRCIS